MSDVKIIFDENLHQYTTDTGQPLISTTTLLKKYNVSADYANIPQAVLDNAAIKGKEVHKNLELYIGGDQTLVSTCPEVSLFDGYLSVNPDIDRSSIKSETMVFDTQYGIAGTVDVMYNHGPDFVIGDFKTTSSLHIEAVSWQLSIYAYLVHKGDPLYYYTTKLKVFHFNNGKLHVRDIHLLDYDAVVGMFKAHKNNIPTYTYVFDTTKIISNTDVQVCTDLLYNIQQTKDTLKKLENELELLLEKVKDNMLKENVYTLTKDELVLKCSLPVTRRTLNSKKVKEYLTSNHLNLDDYMNEFTSAASIKATLVKGTDVYKNDYNTDDGDF